jgi:methylated-DNA-[protein]-cysteine S-methyltransferase
MPAASAPTRIAIGTPWPYDLTVECTGDAIVSARFTHRARRARTPRPALPLLAEAAEQVRAYFARRLDRFDLPLTFEATPFCQAVWECVAQLSFGEFVSYADVARAIGRPLSHRGVAAAMGRTPIDLFVPAHRVVGADGRVKGAAPGGIRLRLVAFERKGRALARGKEPGL